MRISKEQHKKKLDAETQELLRRKEALRDMVKSDGWKHVKAIFSDTILLLNQVVLLEEKDPNDMLVEVRANKKAVRVLIEVYNEIVMESKEYEEHLDAIMKDNTKSFLNLAD